MKDSSEQDKFLSLVIKYHDDNLTEDESNRLKKYLDSSPDYIKQFNDFLMNIHSFKIILQFLCINFFCNYYAIVYLYMGCPTNYF